MPNYVAFIKWTHTGVQHFAESPNRLDAAMEIGDGLGVTFKDVFWTMGPYDIVAVLEAPDDETVSAFALKTASKGNIQTTTMRAFTRDEFEGIIRSAA